MQIDLYVLPTCPICRMVETKLIEKNINFNQYNLENYIEELHTDRAPVMCVDGEIFDSPVKINNFIKTL